MKKPLLFLLLACSFIVPACLTPQLYVPRGEAGVCVTVPPIPISLCARYTPWWSRDEHDDPIK